MALIVSERRLVTVQKPLSVKVLNRYEDCIKKRTIKKCNK